MGWEWRNIEKINWFLSFWVHGVKKLPVYVIRNINFKPIFRHDFAFFSNDFRNKKYPYRVHQINFMLQNINDCDKMKAWKHLTHHGMTKSYGWKVHFSCLGTLKNSILKELAQKGQERLYFTQLFVLISNFAFKIINFVLAVLSRGPTGAWIGV